MRLHLFSPSGPVRAQIHLPASKSISNRVLILRALAGGSAVIENLSDCDDTRVLLSALNQHQEQVDIKAAGTAMRFLTAYFSAVPGKRLLTGTERMQNRPVEVLVDALRQIGACIEYEGKKGYPPLKIAGQHLSGGPLTVKGDISSQYISALLMIAPVLEKGIELVLSGKMVSKPYIDLTLKLMGDFGVEVERLNENHIRIAPQVYRDIPYLIESDWSAASYWYEIALLSERGSQIELVGLDKDSYQGDRRIVEIFALLGIDTEFTSGGVKLEKKEVSAGRLDITLTDQPDLAQTLVIACLLKGIPFRFTGLQSLRIKETDRIEALINECLKLGFLLHAEGDSILYWEGGKRKVENIPVINTYEDHRMAMAFAPVAYKFPSVVIEDAQVVTKSYPSYWNDLKKAGFLICK